MRYSRSDRAKVTVAEFLRHEEESTIRHEYFRGEVYAMSGGTGRHSRIAANIIAALLPAARRTGCQVFTSDFKVHPTVHAVDCPEVSGVCLH